MWYDKYRTTFFRMIDMDRISRNELTAASILAIVMTYPPTALAVCVISYVILGIYGIFIIRKKDSDNDKNTDNDLIKDRNMVQ